MDYNYQLNLCEKLIKDEGVKKKKKAEIRKAPTTIYGGWEE